MRILTFLDTDHLSGPARLALDFCIQAQRMGHTVMMAGLVRGNLPADNTFTQSVRQAGVPLTMLHERWRFDPGVMKQFSALVDSFKPEVYQSHGYKGSLLARCARRRAVAWQAVFHGFTWENWRVRLYHALDVRWLRRAGQVIVVSKAFGQELVARGVPASRTRWIPNAISEEGLRQTDSGQDLRGQWLGEMAPASEPIQPVLAGVLGRFSPEKAPDHFIRAFEQALTAAPHLRAVMVGDGPLLDVCRAQGKDLVDRGLVLMPGFRTDLASIYRALDMLVIPSRSEGMPTVMIEAMLMGVPVISTRVGAVPDVLEDGISGRIVPCEDAPALAQAMAQLAGSQSARQQMAVHGRSIAEKHLTLERRTQTILEHMQCLIQHKPLPEVEWK